MECRRAPAGGIGNHSLAAIVVPIIIATLKIAAVNAMKAFCMIFITGGPAQGALGQFVSKRRRLTIKV
jgi:uncharacterized membrane-anchored protein